MNIQFKNIFRITGLVAVAALAFGLSACEDEPDKYEIAGGSPEVIYIRTPGNADSLITEAYTGTRIVLVGNNLRSITQMYFNEYEAVLNTSLITDHTLFVSVPSGVPANPTDLIYMINNSGDTTTYDFSVLIPAPVLSSASREFVKAGDEITITGNYLLSYDDSPMVITMPDGTEITEFEDLEQANVTFVVPETTESGYISVTTKYGTTKSSKFGLYFNAEDMPGMLFDLDGITGLTNHGWHNATITTDDNAISGNYIQLGNGTAVMEGSSTWDDSNFAFEYWCGDWNDPQLFEGTDCALYDLVDFSDWENMALKFEFCVPSDYPWSDVSMQLIFAGKEHVTLSGYDDADGNSYPAANNTFFQTADNTAFGYELPRALYRPWETESTGSFDTDDEWITVTIPFSEFIYGYEGGTVDTSLQEDWFASFTIFVVSGGVYGTACTPILKIDNIRAVPYE